MVLIPTLKAKGDAVVIVFVLWKGLALGLKQFARSNTDVLLEVTGHTEFVPVLWVSVVKQDRILLV